MALLHTGHCLSSWPVTTALLSKHSNGVITITLPGEGGGNIRPAVGVRPHHPGDLLVIGSDGLEHLDAVTKHCDRLIFLNFLWQHVQHHRSSLEKRLNGLENCRDDEPWRKALALDDTSIAVLWA